MTINSKGYTLIELLVALSIVSTMASFLLIKMLPLHEIKATEYFLEQLSNDLQYLQQYAITNQDAIHVQFNKYERRYYAYTDNINEPFFTKNYPQYIDISYGTLGNYITYNPSGNITKAGTLFFSTDRQTYKMVFYLGKGRFYVERL